MGEDLTHFFGKGAQLVSLKCLYSNVCTWNKQKELEVCLKLQGYDLTQMAEMVG